MDKDSNPSETHRSCDSTHRLKYGSKASEITRPDPGVLSSFEPIVSIEMRDWDEISSTLDDLGPQTHIRKALFEVLFKIKRLLETRQELIHVKSVAVDPTHRSREDTLKVIPRALAESVGEHFIDFPDRRKDAGMLLVVCLQHSLEPCVSTGDVVQRACLYGAHRLLASIQNLVLFPGQK